MENTSLPASGNAWRFLGLLASLALVGGSFGPMISSGTYRLPFTVEFRLGFVVGGLLAATCFMRRNTVLGAVIGAGAGGVASILLVNTWLALRSQDLGDVAQPGWGFALVVGAGAVFVILLIRAMRPESRPRALIKPPAI